MTAPRPAEETRADLAATEHAHPSQPIVGWWSALFRLRWDAGVLSERLAAVERERDEARAANERLGLTAIEANRRAEAAERKVRAAELVHCWTNEDGKRFVFVDDLGVALEIPGFAAPVPPQPDWSHRCGECRSAPKCDAQRDCLGSAMSPDATQPEPERCEHGQTEAHTYFEYGTAKERRCPGPVSPQSTEEGDHAEP